MADSSRGPLERALELMHSSVNNPRSLPLDMSTLAMGSLPDELPAFLDDERIMQYKLGLENDGLDAQQITVALAILSNAAITKLMVHMLDNLSALHVKILVVAPTDEAVNAAFKSLLKYKHRLDDSDVMMLQRDDLSYDCALAQYPKLNIKQDHGLPIEEASYWAWLSIRTLKELTNEFCDYSVAKRMHGRALRLKSEGHDEASAYVARVEKYWELNDQEMKKLDQQKDTYTRETLRDARVVFTTAERAITDELREYFSADVIMMDEAASTTQMDAICAIMAMHESCKRVILFGDTKQQGLLSVHRYQNEASQITARTILNAIKEVSEFSFPEQQIKHYELNRQYRMTPDISEQPSHDYYNGDLKDDESVKGSTLVDNALKVAISLPLAPVLGGRLSKRILVDVKSTGTPPIHPWGKDHTTAYNAEAEAIVHFVKYLLELPASPDGRQAKVEPSDIMIVSLHQDQQTLIEAGLASLLVQKEGCGVERINVLTASQCQSLEAEIVLLSLKVNGPAKHSGSTYLGKKAQLSIALTHAKRFTMVFGEFSAWGMRVPEVNDDTPISSNCWLQKLIKHAAAKGDIVSLEALQEVMKYGEIREAVSFIMPT